MKPEAKAKRKARHNDAVGAFVAWLDQFPKGKYPPLHIQVKKFDQLVDAEAEQTNKPKKKRIKIEHTSST